MRKEYKNQVYVPSTNATVFEFQVNSKADQRVNILVEKTDESFSLIETGTDKKVLIGSLIDLMKYLDKASGRWLVRKKTKAVPKRLFYNKEFCKYLLSIGYTMIHIQSGLSWVWNQDYTGLIVSDGSIRTEDQLPPSGTFAIDFCQERNKKTRREVQDERLKLEQERLKAEKAKSKEQKEAAKKAFTEFLKQQQLMSNKIIDKACDEKSKGKVQPTPVVVETTETKKKWPYLVAAAVGGIIALVGERIVKKNQSFRNAS